MKRYAEATAVSSEKSRAEIEATLIRYGAEQFLYGWEAGRSVVQFQANGRRIRFSLPMPDRASREFTHHSRGVRTAEAATALYEQAVRQRWRALALVIKAKLEAVAAGITEFEDEFLANIVLPDGGTVGDFVRPQLAVSYARGSMPAMLPAPKGDA